MRKRDDARTPTSRPRSVALVLLCLLCACLNPRPEELPSSTLLEPDPGADRLAPPGANAESAPTPTSAPDEGSADDTIADSTLAAPEPPATPPGDAGASADVELDAGIGDDSPPDGG